MSIDSSEILFALQAFQVAFLCLHDWVPLPPLNDVNAAREANPDGKLLRTTIVSALPFVLCLVTSAFYLRSHYPDWLLIWLWATYGTLFAGELRAWWYPYFVRAEPARATRYAFMFRRTAAILPERNGIRPNTLHLILHSATVATLICLATFRNASS